MFNLILIFCSILVSGHGIGENIKFTIRVDIGIDINQDNFNNKNGIDTKLVNIIKK